MNEYVLPVITIEGGQLHPAESIKYLGAYLDPKLKFHQHIDEAIAKYRHSIPALISICQNTFGYTWMARKVMVQGVVYSHLFYYSSVFYHRLSLGLHQNQLHKLQRQCDEMCIRAYRTISANAAAVLNIFPPLIHHIQVCSICWLQTQGRDIRQPAIFEELLADEAPL